MKAKSIFPCTFLVSLLLASGFACLNAVEGTIDGNQLRMRDKRDLVVIPKNLPGRQIKVPIPETKPPTDEDLTNHALSIYNTGSAGKLTIPHIPCSSPDASNTLVLAPPDAPGVQRGQFGQTYLCLPKTPDGQPADPIEYTLPNGETVTAPEPIIVTAEDFQNLGILPSEAHQERAPHTLKNYNTNFWASPREQTFDIEMGGVPVQVRAIPIAYTFTYGDGQTLNTTNPGYQLGEDVWDQETPTSHKYAEPGDFNYSVTTYYRGEFSVAGGPWQVIDGTGQATSDPQLIRVWRVKAGLVADDCATNPSAWGCPGQ